MQPLFVGCEHQPRERARPVVGGVEIDPLTARELAPVVEGFLACGRSHVVHFLPADPIVRARREPRYREVLNRGSLNVPDGRSVVWALRMQGVRSDRVAGTDAMHRLTSGALRHFLAGGTPDVLRLLGDRLTSNGAEVVGASSPPFRPLGESDVRDLALRSRQAKAQLLWLGLGTPRQDVLAERLRALEAAPVILCVGAAFDFVSGAKRRAPSWMQQAGLEWAHRLVSEPGRLWRRYLLGNPAFVWGVARDLIGSRRRR